MPRWAQWAVVIASLVYALLFVRFEWSGAAAYVLALQPTVLTFVITSSWLAAAFVFLLPMYFVIGQATAGDLQYQPFVALDHAMPSSPAWIFVYASLYFCAFILPLVVVRGDELFTQTMKAFLFVMLASYVGFWFYPTTAPRIERASVDGFAEWCLQSFYDIDQPYGCFPSLHVAYSFVGALACYRLHRGLGLAATAWAILIGVSTIYTKQHFVVDAIAGALLGAAAYGVFLRGRPREPVAPDFTDGAPRRALAVVGGYAAAIGGFWLAYQLGLGPVSR